MTYDYRGARESILDSDMPGVLKLLALVLVEHMPICKPSVALLAKRSSSSRKTVMRRLVRLERLRVLTVERSPGSRSTYHLQPVPISGTGPIAVPPVPPRVRTGDTGVPAPGTLGCLTGDTSVPQSGLKQISESSIKRNGHATILQPTARDRAAADRNGAQPVLRYEFAPDWQPSKAHQARAQELGLTDDEVFARAEDCKLKVHKQGFRTEDAHFMRELVWAKNDKDTRLAKEARSGKHWETPGRDRVR